MKTPSQLISENLDAGAAQLSISLSQGQVTVKNDGGTVLLTADAPAGTWGAITSLLTQLKNAERPMTEDRPSIDRIEWDNDGNIVNA